MSPLPAWIPAVILSAAFLFAAPPKNPLTDLSFAEENYKAWLKSFEDWPTDNVKLDFNGLDLARFRPPPPPGVHPRVFINPEDVPLLQKKAAETKLGQIVIAKMREEVAKLKADADYQKLLAGDESGARKGIIRQIASAALVSLIDNDEALAKELAKALETFASDKQKQLFRKGEIELHQGADKWNPRIKEEFSGVLSWQHWSMAVIDHHHIGYAYDFLYNWMTPGQRDTVRKAIASATAKHYSWAMGIAGQSTHNWDLIHANLGILCLAIEGEEGYDPKVAAWTKQLLANYFTYAIYDSGTSHEREGKNAVSSYFALPFSRRDLSGIIPVKFPENLMAIPNIRKYVTGYILNHMVPWRGRVQLYGAWGGSDIPMSYWLGVIMPVKFAFPEDPVVDYVWRCSVGENYEEIEALKVSGHEFGGDTLLQLMLFGGDYSSKVGLEDQLKEISPPLDYFCPQRLLVESRSDWSTEALQFMVHAQQMFSAHPRHGHGKFLLNGLGRPWTYHAKIADSAGPLGHVADSEHYSTVRVDGVGTGYQNSRGVDFVSKPEAMFVSVDNTFTFTWETNPKPKTEPVWENWGAEILVSQMRPLYQPDRPFPGNSKSLDDLPDWDYPGHVGTATRTTPPLVHRFPVAHAFRTAGLVRGKHPYAVIVDDIRKSPRDAGEKATQHNYDWIFILQPDLSIASQTDREVVLKEKDGPRRLLIRALEIEGGRPVLGKIEDFPGYGWSDRVFERFHGKRLLISSRSVEPRFKFLLYPFREGDPLPKTDWKNGKASIAWDDQQDTLSFSQQPNGLTSIRFDRGGQNILQINGGQK